MDNEDLLHKQIGRMMDKSVGLRPLPKPEVKRVVQPFPEQAYNNLKKLDTNKFSYLITDDLEGIWV